MSESEKIKIAIQSVIKEMMDQVMERVLIIDPFISEKHRSSKPLYAALVPDEIFKGSHFERRFVTPFGKVWEKLAVVAGREGLGHCQMAHTICGTVKSERLRRISETLNKLEHPPSGQSRTKPDWDRELSYILEGDGEDIPVQVVCDIYAVDKTTGEKYAFELKAPLPNSDQTKVSKEKILKLHSMEPQKINGSYFALPYNPYGKKEDYKWSFPSRWFNMQQDEVVLIGNEFWDKIGGVGTYQAFIKAVNEIGQEYRERIYREFLEIEPPINASEFNLDEFNLDE
ncbi:Restriction endonuclease, type II, MjaII [Crinalium epipsammum PCC 9333]|uniref:type II site-specific deoxyribonuclease n=1 Tax=Crinalium epipsammum PCC 9333 TaxID=1173022 RepID=K9W2U7_9CYAN|nr:TdeIII family type II restriction endonuclease [Crinalium epipsammum]AFZ14688.1 Restriction endonuclease, type II, MjaII [Crinalium epipsammum PCC 9333]